LEKKLYFGEVDVIPKIFYPFGTAEEIKFEVKKRNSNLKSGGGFVFSQVHKIQPDTPPENIVKCTNL
jgi:uroporphyrinogen-III decarboxylase